MKIYIVHNRYGKIYFAKKRKNDAQAAKESIKKVSDKNDGITITEVVLD